MQDKDRCNFFFVIVGTVLVRYQMGSSLVSGWHRICERVDCAFYRELVFRFKRK